jgi:hypothetical protein
VNAKPLTIVDRILLAAAELAERGESFSAEDLVVSAWQLWPDQFGLQGHPEHPDSNRVLTKIMGGDSPLRKRGLLEKLGTKRYRLTRSGLMSAAELRNRDAVAGARQRLVSLDRELVVILSRMIHSTALARFVQHQDLTFGDVCRLLNISPRSTAGQLAARREDAVQAINVALRAAKENSGQVVLPGNGSVVLEHQLLLLAELLTHLEDRFAGEIAVIRARRDERRS